MSKAADSPALVENSRVASHRPEPSVELVIPRECVGGSVVVIALVVKNLSLSSMSNLNVEVVKNPALPTGPSESSNDSVSLELTKRRRRLMDDLQVQATTAYMRLKSKQRTALESTVLNLTNALRNVIDTYIRIFTLSFSSGSSELPNWASNVFTVNSMADVERLELEIVNQLDSNSFLYKAFKITKEKFKDCLDEIEQAEIENYLALEGETLAPGASTSVSFSFKLPHRLKRYSTDAQFRIQYSVEQDDVVIQKNVSGRIDQMPSAFAVPTGGMVGAMIGYLIRICLVEKSSSIGFLAAFNGGHFIGSLALGLVSCLITARRIESKKPISVEDFVGGVVLGCLAGLFSEQFIEKLAAFIK